MPFRHDIRSVTLPGCVDGWISLHERFGSIPLADVLEPAIRIAEHGFPASPLLVGSLATIDDAARANLHEIATQATHVGALVRRSGVGRTLRAVAANGRSGFYGGEFAAGLLDLGRGYFSPPTSTARRPTGSRHSRPTRSVSSSTRSHPTRRDI